MVFGGQNGEIKLVLEPKGPAFSGIWFNGKKSGLADSRQVGDFCILPQTFTPGAQHKVVRLQDHHAGGSTEYGDDWESDLDSPAQLKRFKRKIPLSLYMLLTTKTNQLPELTTWGFWGLHQTT
ncbi:MAG: hypothetical protein H7A33_05290 [Deltaproteobacteria bacterium]|nr:hypothetical protein [Deltaproteobacteria bacterium]